MADLIYQLLITLIASTVEPSHQRHSLLSWLEIARQNEGMGEKGRLAYHALCDSYALAEQMGLPDKILEPMRHWRAMH